MVGLLLASSGVTAVITFMCLLVVAVIKKKPKKFYLLCLTASVIFSVLIFQNDDKTLNTLGNEVSEDTSTSIIESKTLSIEEPKTIFREYDKMQKLYLYLNSNMSYQEVLETVINSELPYTDKKYSGGRSRQIRVAYTEKAAEQGFIVGKQETTDCIDIYFERDENDRESYIYTVCVYFSYSRWHELIEHSGRTNHDSKVLRKGKEYKGLYIADKSKTGNDKYLDFPQYSTKEDQLYFLLNDITEKFPAKELESISETVNTTVITESELEITTEPETTAEHMTEPPATVKPTKPLTTTERPIQPITTTEAPTTEPTTAETTQPPTTEKPKIFIVYWGHTGKKMHISPTCSTITNGVLSGTYDEAIAYGRDESWCGRCSDGWTDERFFKDGNPYAK